jgi:hypothetical protein
MQKLLASCAAATVTLAVFAIQPADAFVPAQPEIAQGASATRNIIEVKRAPTKAHPPGWSRGRKVGWHGRGKPPGQVR